MQNNAGHKILVTIKEIEDYLRVSRGSVKRYIKDKGLPVAVIGGLYHCPTSLLDLWIIKQGTAKYHRRKLKD